MLGLSQTSRAPQRPRTPPTLMNMTGIVSSGQYLHPSGRPYVSLSPNSGQSPAFGHKSTNSRRPDPSVPTAVDIKPQAPETTESNNENKSEDASQKTSWHVYNEKADRDDAEFIESINGSMDVLLIFAGLFSATATAFLGLTRPLLQEDEVSKTNDLLLALFYKMENSSYALPESKPFVVPVGAWAINCLVFASIAGSLVAAFFAILVKQWAASLTSGLASIPTPQLRARTRHFRAEGVRRFYFAHVASFLPVIVHISLVLFGIGIVEFLFYTKETSIAIVVTTWLVVGAGAYLFLSLLPLFSMAAPFRSPMTTILMFLHTLLRRFIKACSGRPQAKMSPKKQALNELIGKQDAVSKLIHLSWKLDMDVLVSLMAMADKHTERWVLEQILMDMQALTKIQEESPQLLWHPAVLRTFSYLVSTSIDESGSRVTLAQGREHRARTLCRFIIWLGSVAGEKTSVQDLGRILQEQTIGDDNTGLPTALYMYGTLHNRLDDVVLGEMALNELGHIGQTTKQQCTKCVDFVVNGASTNPESEMHNYLIDIDPEEYSNDTKEARLKREHIIRYIASQTRCLATFAPLQEPSTLAVSRLEELTSTFELGDPIFANLWRELVPVSKIRSERPHLASWLNLIEPLQKDAA